MRNVCGLAPGPPSKNQVRRPIMKGLCEVGMALGMEKITLAIVRDESWF
jgi:hypothetical protein